MINTQSTSVSARGFKTLSAKILTFVGTPVILAIIMVSLVLLNLVSSTITNLRSNELSASSIAAANEINGYFEKHLEIVRTLATNVEIEALFNEVVPGTKIELSTNYLSVKQTLANVQTTNSKTVMAVWVADVDSSQLAQADGVLLTSDTWNIQGRAWFKQLSNAKTAIMTEPYEDTVTKQQIVSVVAPVFQPGSEKIIGVTGLDFSLEGLGKIISSYTLGKTGFCILTTESGQIIYHPVSEYLNRNVSDIVLSDNIKSAMLSKTAGNMEYTSHGITSHGYISPVGNTGWMIATGLPNAEYDQEFNSIRNMMLIIFSIAIVIIGAVLLILSKRIVSPIKSLTKTANLIADGNLDVTAQVASKDETGQMAEAINRTVIQLRRYTAYIREITSTLENMANGDMRIRLNEDYVGEFASIKSAFVNISTSLNKALHNINIAAEQVSIGASQVANGAQALAAGATEQSSSVEELNASIIKIAEQASDNSANVKIATQSVEQAGLGVTAGNEHMTQLTEAMTDIGSASNQIANITRVIEDIAFQTNILALNAAIEAARAGNAGKGFAVVADEVRNLAGKSAEAAKQTGELIQRSVASVSKGTQLAMQTAEILTTVGVSTVEVADSFSKIAQASAEQAGAIEQIKQGLAQVSSIVQTNAATAEENSASSEEMSAQAASLREEVGNFKLDLNIGRGNYPASSMSGDQIDLKKPLNNVKSTLGRR
jgi:methyl-accepting chemotaxis protein